MSVRDISDRDLLYSIGVGLEELKRRKIIENDNIIEGLTRYLFQNALGLQLLNRSNKGFHATSGDGTVKYRIKGRCDPAFAHYGTSILSDFRNLDDEKTRFDFLLTAIYDDFFKVIEAAQIPFDLVHARDRSDSNASVFTLTKEMLRHPRVESMTASLRQVLK